MPLPIFISIGSDLAGLYQLLPALVLLDLKAGELLWRVADDLQPLLQKALADIGLLHRVYYRESAEDIAARL